MKTWKLFLAFLAWAGPAYAEVPCWQCINRGQINVTAIVHGTKSDGFWRQVQRAALTAGENLHINLNYELFDRFDSVKMADKILAEAAKKPHAMIVTIPSAQVQVAIQTVASQVPVFSLNSGYDVALSLGVKAHFSMHEYNGGLFAGHRFEEKFTAGGKTMKLCLTIDHEVGNGALATRQAGFFKYCTDKGLLQETIAVNGANVDAMRGMLTVKLGELKTANKLDGVAILCLGQASVLSVVKEVKLALGGSLGNNFIATFDTSADVYTALTAGDIIFGVDQNQWLQGYLPVLLAAMYASTGQLMAPEIYMTGPAFVTEAPDIAYSTCIGEAFPVCKCPWSSGDESKITKAMCTDVIGTSPSEKSECPCQDIREIKIRGVVHGTESDSFWHVVRAGALQAAMDYRLADFQMNLYKQFNTASMAKDIEQHGKDPSVDGIFVTLPGSSTSDVSQATKVAAASKWIVSINSGGGFVKDLFAGMPKYLAHISQDEFVGGQRAARILIAKGATNMICIVHEFGNSGLDARCLGAVDYAAGKGAAVTTLQMGQTIDTSKDDLITGYIKTKLTADTTINGLLLTAHLLGDAALRAMAESRSVPTGSFDTSGSIFDGITSGKILFGVDQLPYMQGYMAVVMLVVKKLTGLSLALPLNKVLASGPFMVTTVDATQAKCLAQDWTKELVGAAFAKDFTRAFPVCEFKPPIDCDAGMHLNTENTCVPCMPGRFKVGKDQATECPRCPTGTYNMKSGSASCFECSPGNYTGTVGNALCKMCDPGKYTMDARKSACTRCAPGYFQNVVGESSCKPCEKGKYVSASSATQCINCPGSLDTQYPGVANEAKCLCPAATYRTLKGDCASCPAGMTCGLGSAQFLFQHYIADKQQSTKWPFDSQAPKLNAGFYSRSDEPLSVFLCEPEWVCKGGLTGKNACSGDRAGFMCTDCAAGYVTNGDLEDDPSASGCTKCETAMLLYLIVVPIIGLILLGVVLHDTRHSPLDESPLLIELKMVSGQVIMFLQILGCLAAANLSFGYPMTGGLASLSAPIELDQFFISTPCITSGFKDTVTMFAIQISMPAAFVVILVLVFGFIKVIKPGLLKFDGLLNCIGEVLIEFYVSITIAVLAPFNCYEHPNGKQSMKGQPHVLCNETDHTTLMALSVLALLMYPLSCFGITLLATWQHPKRMAKNDIAILVRCHFIFNRWRPQCYWFAVPAVARNFFVALWPMVIPEADNDVAVMMMIATLLIALCLLCLIKPRRTPAMGALDVQISSTQLMILAVGAMSAYTGSLKSDFMSWVLMFSTAAIFIVSGIIVFLKGMSWLTRSRSPGSWCFDIFLDHHAGGGASAVRALHVFLTNVVQKGKVFYDVDWYNANNGVLGVITDAVQLSKNCLVVLGNETWCRDWCVAAIVSGVSKKIPMQTLTGGVCGFRSLDVDFSMSIVDTLAKQAPRERLRPIGLADGKIPGAMKVIFKIKPVPFYLRDQQKMESFVTTLLNITTGVTLQKSIDQFPAITSKFFSKTTIKKTNEGATWYDKDQEYVLISADQEDLEAVAVSHLTYSLLGDLIGGFDTKPPAQRTPLLAGTDGRGSADGFEQTQFTPQETAAMQALRFIEDYDLEAFELKDLVASGKIPVVLVLFTSKSFQSVSQLMRLGLVHKYAHQTRFKAVPLAISAAFRFPGLDVLSEIESGAVLPAGMDEMTAAMQYASEGVSFSQARQALSHVLENRMAMMNVAVENEANLRTSLKKTLFRIIYARDDTQYGTDQSIPTDLTFTATDSIKADPGQLLNNQATITRNKTTKGASSETLDVTI